MRFSFAFSGDFERYGDVTTIDIPVRRLSSVGKLRLPARPFPRYVQGRLLFRKSSRTSAPTRSAKTKIGNGRGRKCFWVGLGLLPDCYFWAGYQGAGRPGGLSGISAARSFKSSMAVAS